MAIHGISGKPGGGKSLYALKLTIEELVYGDRTVITNLALELGELNEYLQKEHPTKSIDLHKRVRLLDDDETGRFWTIRPEGSKGPSLLNKQAWEMKLRPDYSGISDNGVFYVIDEVHNYFNARAWMETGRDVLFYLSQHRKIADTVIWVTQHINNVDKQFRSVTQDYTYLRNLSKEKHSLFTMPSLFMRRTYGEPATPTSQALETGTFALDVSGIAKCYNTAKGVSIHGAGADKKEKRKGIPWYYVVIIVPVAIILIYMTVPRMFANYWMKNPAKQVEQIQTKQTEKPKPIKELNQQPAALPVGTKIEPAKPKITACVTGVDTLLGKYRVYLSTGESYLEGEAGLEEIGRNYVIINGNKLFFCH